MQSVTHCAYPENSMYPSLLRRAIAVAMRKPAPDHIPLSNMERVRLRDYNAVYLGDDQDQIRFLVREVLPHGLRGFWFLGSGSDSEIRTISNRELQNYSLLITRYIGELEITYTSPLGFLFSSALHIDLYRLYRERLFQYLFNHRSLDEKRRIQVLRLMLDGLLSGNPLRSGIDIMSELYGARWARHPQHVALHSYYEFMLEAFVASGDVVLDDHAYRLLPQGMNTIHAFEEEERRHNGNVAVQRWMLFVTAMVGIATAAQAWTAIFPVKK
ncbi:hypothetical protein ELG67_09785 [Rhizobium leguminosarum]|uniref:hypothetical protein n=1 Tax=Rhizobium leguminosarum TaxID=384 RepID=UPI001036FBFF|nr:hypothetical protein [Rhizobium leguminosarum]TBG89359.1 hypothetical protein ELG67_09785 [Rhizobium leguminosarum]